MCFGDICFLKTYWFSGVICCNENITEKKIKRGEQLEKESCFSHKNSKVTKKKQEEE